MQYAKGIVAVIGATIAAAIQTFGANPWLVVALAFVTAFGVYMVPNLPTPTAIEDL